MTDFGFCRNWETWVRVAPQIAVEIDKHLHRSHESGRAMRV